MTKTGQQLPPSDRDEEADEDLVTALKDANRELAIARRRPWRTLATFAAFRLLRALSRFSPPLPSRMAARFCRIAAKRDPNRSLRRTAETDPAQRMEVNARSIRYGGLRPHRPDRKAVLLVSHEATRTGAPILAHNIADSLSARYDVTILNLRGGPLHDAFRAVAQDVWVADLGNTGQKAAFRDLLGEIRAVETRSFAFAIVNSAASYRVLAPLRDARVPTVALVHEFAVGQYPPREAFNEILAAADRVVFSSRLTFDSVLEANQLVEGAIAHILPQGQCDVPRDAAGKFGRAMPSGLPTVLRPESTDLRRGVVLGAGTVSFRKGTDIFVTVAQQVHRLIPDRMPVFVWVGNAPDKDYKSHIDDQIARANLTGHVQFVSETDDIADVYAQSDMLLLSSRLDPLPNVAIDALSLGLPVVCFRGATGIAPLLEEAGLGSDCVAEYLDATGMATKIAKLAVDAPHRKAVGVGARGLAADRFDMARYVATLETLGLGIVPGRADLDQDIDTIMKAETFRTDFYRPDGRTRKVTQSVVTAFTEAGFRGIGPRKPEPGFHPGIYRNDPRADCPPGRDPYAAYLRSGRPAGPWAFEVLTPGPPAGEGLAEPAGDPRVALHIHAHYTDGLPYLLDRLALNAARPDLFVTVSDDMAQGTALGHLERAGQSGATVRVVPNLGRDIGPLLSALGPRLVAGYDIVGHVHCKKSIGIADPEIIERWRMFLEEGLLGGRAGGAMMDRILARMTADDGIGIVYPDDPNVIAWGRNRPLAAPLAARLGLAQLPGQFNFPVGTMFWARAGALRPFVDLGLTLAEYPREPLAGDGTLLHTLERLFGIVPGAHGWRTVVTHVPGVSR